MASRDDRTSIRLVDGLNTLFGIHRNYRAAHAKGICCLGVSQGECRRGRADPGSSHGGRRGAGNRPLLQRCRSSASSRWHPRRPRDGRAFPPCRQSAHRPPGDHLADLSRSRPRRLHRAHDCADGRPGPTHQPDAKKIEAFKKAHPELQAALAIALGAPALESYARAAYYAVHAFRFTNAAGQARFIRYIWRPQAGAATIPPEEAQRRAPDYLQTELRGRLAGGPVVFTLYLQLAGDGDDVNDPATAWPESRASVLAGTLRLTALVSDQRGGCEALVFDPSVVTDGIACSDDRILNARARRLFGLVPTPHDAW